MMRVEIESFIDKLVQLDDLNVGEFFEFDGCLGVVIGFGVNGDFDVVECVLHDAEKMFCRTMRYDMMVTPMRTKFFD